MRKLDDQRSTMLYRGPDISVEGTMRISGFDATVDGRGVRLEQRTPDSLTIRQGGDVRVVSMRPAGNRGRRLAMIAMPLAAYAIARLVRAPGRRDR